MKKLTVLLAVILLISMIGAGTAEETAEYRDKVYSFRYPASWSQDVSGNGDIVLLSPSGTEAVITFAIVSDLVRFSGDAETDGPLVELYVSQYEGKNLKLNGEYEPVHPGDLVGYRTFGSWRSTGQSAEMVLLTGSRHMVGFVFVGDGAIGQESVFLDSIELLGDEPGESTDGFMRWNGEDFSLDYPDHYGTMEQSTGVVFLNPGNSNNIIMARTYDLDVDYSDEMATIIAANALPKSTKVDPKPEMTEIGGRSAAVITGTVSNGPMHFYAFGSGRKAMILMLTGEEAVGYAETVIRSVEIH